MERYNILHPPSASTWRVIKIKWWTLVWMNYRCTHAWNLPSCSAFFLHVSSPHKVQPTQWPVWTLSGLYGQNSVACMDLKTDLSTVKHSRMCPCIQPHLSCMQSERCTPLYFKHSALHNYDTDHTYNVMQDCMLYLVYYKHRNKHYYKSNLNFINFCSTNNYVGRDK